MKQTQWATRLIFLAFGLSISSWAPMVPFVKERLGLDDAQLGLTFLLSGFGALGAMPLSGWLIHRFGSRSITLFSGLFVAGLLPFLASASTPFALSLILFLFGIATGALNIAINAQAVSVEAKSSVSLMSGFHCLFSTGGLLGALTISALLKADLALSFCALAISFVMLFLLITQWGYLLSKKEEKVTTKQKVISFSFLNYNLFLLGLICFISFMAEGSMIDWSAEFLHSSLNYEPTVAGIGYAIFSIAMAFGRLVGDQLIQRFNVLSVFQVGCFLAAAGFALVISLNLHYLELFGFCLIGFGASNIVPILFSASARVSTASPDMALTIVTTFGYVGSLVGPAFIGFVAEATTLSAAFACISFFFMAMGLSGRLVISDVKGIVEKV
jgi:predicted MFS family arabinose efflux permease